jgi:hypothetical protein
MWSQRLEGSHGEMASLARGSQLRSLGFLLAASNSMLVLHPLVWWHACEVWCNQICYDASSDFLSCSGGSLV